MRRLTILVLTTLVSSLFGQTCAVSRGTPPAAIEPSVNAAPGATGGRKPQTEETATIKNAELTLKDCTLSYQLNGAGESFDFDFPAPCHFGRDAKGKIKTVQTSKKTVTLLVYSTQAKAGTSDCRRQSRAVVVADKSVRLSARQTGVSASCSDDLDDTEFFVSANKTVSFQEAKNKQK